MTSQPTGEPRDASSSDEATAASADVTTPVADDATAPEVDEVVVRPGRPDMKRADPPRSQVMTRPQLLDRALMLIRIGIGFGAVALLSGVIWRNDARRALLGLMTDLDGSEASKTSLAGGLIYASLVTMAVFLLVQLILLTRLSHGRGWVRWFLVIWVPVNIAVLVFTQEIISGDRWHAMVIQLFLLVQAVTSVVGVAMTFAPVISRWVKQSRRPPKTP